MPPVPRPPWIATACAIALATVAPLELGRADTRRAVLVGISRYPEQYGWPPLPGAAGDVELVRASLLAHGGFEAEHIVVLRDQEATRLAIQGELERLASASKPGDLALFYFAGHGSRLADQGQDELDPFDETIVPFDAGKPPDKANDIRDDWIGDWITRANKRTDQVVLLFDCCSSGTNTRGGDTVRYLDPRARGFDAPRRSRAAEEHPTRSQGYAPAGGRYVALSACRASENAYEVRIPGTEGQPDRVHGAFTWELTQGIAALSGTGTWADLSAHVAARLRGQEHRQTPTIEGRLAGYRLFSGEAAPNARRFGLARTAAGTWVLEGGSLQALAAGALLSAGPAAARRDELAQRVGRVRIVRAGRTKSEVAWIEGVPPEPVDGIAPACSAFLLEHGTDRARLSFALAGEDVATADLAQRLEASNLLVRAEPADSELTIVRETGPTRERWIVQSRRGRNLPLAAALSSRDELERLYDNLARLALARRARTLLVNDAADTLAVDFHLHARPIEGEAETELPRDASGALLVPSDTPLRLELANASVFPVHAAVLWIGPDGEISLVAGTTEEEEIGPGRAAVYDLEPLELPPGREAFFAEAPLALVCVVSVGWHDFAPLYQEPVTLTGTRGGGASEPQSDPLECEGWSTRVLEIVLAPSAR